MPVCERLPKCAFFNDKMKDMPAMSELYKRQYCQDDFGVCARHRVAIALGADKVPADLFPNQASRVSVIVQEAKTGPEK